jgi:hypothetical protein
VLLENRYRPEVGAFETNRSPQKVWDSSETRYRSEVGAFAKIGVDRRWVLLKTIGHP